MFSSCNGLGNLSGLANWDVGSVKNMSSMFSSCNGLTSLDSLSGWNVGNVTDMSSMFSSCNNLSNLKGLENWNVGNVTNMSSMFSHEASGSDFDNLTDISALSCWNVSNVKDMSSMFNSCGALESIEPLSGWAREASKDSAASNVSNVTNMSSMFSGCTHLGNLKGLEKWKVSNVKDMSRMFADCKKLTGAADLSKWDISKVTDLSSMFSNAGAESGDNFVLDFSNKTFTKSKTPLANANPDDKSKHYFSVDGMFDGFKGTLIANGWESKDFDDHPGDNPIESHFAKGAIFSKTDDNPSKSNNIVVTNNDVILSTISKNNNLKKIAYYKVVNAKLIESGEMNSCTCGDSSGTTYTYDVPALYDSTTITKVENEPLQDYAYKVVKSSFASKLGSAINGSQTDDTGKGNTYKIWFKKPKTDGTKDTCTWTKLGDKDDAVPVSNPKSPLVFFTTTYYLETFVQPVPLPHTGGQSAVMFKFLSFGLFSMFAVAGAFARRHA